jgi:hypothetical protein
MGEDDGPALEAIVERHEGPESARLAARWFARQPESVVIYRDMEQRPAGFVMKLDLHGTTDEDRRADPAVRAARRHLERSAPLRPGEKATLFRFWMARDTYQGVSAMQSLIFGNIAQHYLTTPGLAFTFFPAADPDFWAPMFAYVVDLGRAREADFEVGGRRYGVYVHDWRVTPPMEWLDLLAERGVATEPLAVPAAASTPLVVLGESDFAAVREALRDFHRTDALRTNPLLRSRVVERAGTDDGAGLASLRGLLKETSESLQVSPREAKPSGSASYLPGSCAQPGARRGATRSAFQHLPPSPEGGHLEGGRVSVARGDRRPLNLQKIWA